MEANSAHGERHYDYGIEEGLKNLWQSEMQVQEVLDTCSQVRGVRVGLQIATDAANCKTRSN